jgi:hypothetical protein
VSGKLKLFLIALLLTALMLPIPAYAASQTEPVESGLTIYFQSDHGNLVGVTFAVYRIADMTEDMKLRAADRFSGFEDSLQDISDPRKLTAELEYYVLEQGLKPDGTCISGQDGTAQHPEPGETLAHGLYLLIGKRHVQDGYIYEINPMLVTFPYYDEGSDEWVEHFLIKAKYERTPIPEDGKITRKVLKVWTDEGHEEKRPVSITVKLLKDGKVYDTVVLDRSNNWSYTWENLSADAEWTILEESPEYYRPSVTLEGITFVLNNSYTPPPEPPTEPPTEPTEPPTEPTEPPPSEPTEPPSEPTEPPSEPTVPPSPPPNLPQTGQLWWPVPLLFLMGIMCVIIGLVRRREDYYEE